MFEIATLQDLCMDAICDSIETLTEDSEKRNASSSVRKKINRHSKSSSNSNSSHPVQDVNVTLSLHRIKVKFKEMGVCFPYTLSDALLEKLSQRGKLSDLAITLFDPTIFRLREVKIPRGKNLTVNGLKFLKSHKIVSLEIIGVRVCVKDLIEFLGQWTLENLHHLNVRHCNPRIRSKFCQIRTNMSSLSKLCRLQSLNVSHTQFNSADLKNLTENLPHMQMLDISAVRLMDIDPLYKWSDSLKSLIMRDTVIYNVENAVKVLVQMHKLQIFDTSVYLTIATEVNISALLNTEDIFKDLQKLDISGCKQCTVKDLEHFLKNHRNLKFLGLTRTDLCSADVIMDPKHPYYNPNLMVAGDATDDQILQTIQHYMHQVLYLGKTLSILSHYLETHQARNPPIVIIKVVLKCMEVHPKFILVHESGLHCIYLLTKGNLYNRTHPHTLKCILKQVLTSLEMFPKKFEQLHKHCLTILCVERLLEEVSYDKFHCAQLVANTFCVFGTITQIQRLSIPICDFLLPHLTASQASSLGTHPEFINKLLHLISAKIKIFTVDSTMKGALSVIWGLSDESVDTCKLFLDEGGLDIYMKALTVFEDDETVEAKVLGAFSNIAEASKLKLCLMDPKIFNKMRKLLHSEHSDVSFLAAAIISLLVIEEDAKWTKGTGTRLGVLEELGRVVLEWKEPTDEMVTYRSLKAFIPLLLYNKGYQVQFYAVWALHHICSKNAEHYCPMLLKDNIVPVLNQLNDNLEVHTYVRSVCQKILDISLQVNFPVNICYKYVKM